MKKVSSALKNYIIDAILLIILGLVMVIWPEAALKTLFTWMGICFLVMGAVKAAVFFLKKDKEERSVPRLIVGIIQIIIGIFFIVKSDFLIAFFPTVEAIILAYGAIVMLIRAVKLRNENKNVFTLSLVLGIVALVLAIIVFFHPVLIADIMVQAAGVSMIIEGVSLLIVLSRKVQA